MGGNVQTGLTSVTGTVEALPSRNTVVIATQTRSSAGTTTIGTVPANKVWRIIYMQVCMTVTGSSTNASQILLNGVIAMEVRPTGTTGSYGGLSEAATFDFGACPVLTAGQLAVLTTVSNDYGRGVIGYVEEDA